LKKWQEKYATRNPKQPNGNRKCEDTKEIDKLTARAKSEEANRQ
jgi:hypothetical protein